MTFLSIFYCGIRGRLVHRDFYALGLMLSITWMNSTARIKICLVQSLQTVGVSNILVSQSLSSFTAMTLASGCSLTTWLHSRTPAGLFLSLQDGHGDSSPKLVGILIVLNRKKTCLNLQEWRDLNFIILIEEKTLTEKYFILEEKLRNFRKKRWGKIIPLSSIAIHIVTTNEKYNFEYELRNVKF